MTKPEGAVISSTKSQRDYQFESRDYFTRCYLEVVTQMDPKCRTSFVEDAFIDSLHLEGQSTSTERGVFELKFALYLELLSRINHTSSEALGLPIKDLPFLKDRKVAADSDPVFLENFREFSEADCPFIIGDFVGGEENMINYALHGYHPEIDEDPLENSLI